MNTSKLQLETTERIKVHFGGFGIKENFRPPWLQGLEIDIFIDALSVGIEVQGLQHIKRTPFFHKTELAFTEQQYRDKRKATICEGSGITLFYVYEDSDITWVIRTIYDVCRVKERTTIDDDWMSDDVPTRADSNKRFRQLIMQIGLFLREKRERAGMAEIIREIYVLVNEKYLTLTKRQLKKMSKAREIIFAWKF